MKKIFMCALILSCMIFCSCGKAVSMENLLKYQSDDYRANVRINGEIEAAIEKSGDAFSVTLTSPQAMAGVKYLLSGGELFICYEEIKIKVDKSSPFSVSNWVQALSLQASDVWKITKEAPSGANVYKCVSESVTVYIDAAGKYPVRIEKADETIDFISFEVIKQSSSE